MLWIMETRILNPESQTPDVSPNNEAPTKPSSISECETVSRRSISRLGLFGYRGSRLSKEGGLNFMVQARGLRVWGVRAPGHGAYVE